MAGRRAAQHALSMVIDLHGRLTAAGVPPALMPDLDQAVDMVWDLARQIARLEKSGKKAKRSAERAREAALESAAANWTAATMQRFRDFDPGQWHVELVPGPSSERDRQVA